MKSFSRSHPASGRRRACPPAHRHAASFARRVGSKLGQALPQYLWPTPNQHVSPSRTYTQ